MEEVWKKIPNYENYDVSNTVFIEFYQIKGGQNNGFSLSRMWTFI